MAPREKRPDRKVTRSRSLQSRPDSEVLSSASSSRRDHSVRAPRVKRKHTKDGSRFSSPVKEESENRSNSSSMAHIPVFLPKAKHNLLRTTIQNPFRNIGAQLPRKIIYILAVAALGYIFLPWESQWPQVFSSLAELRRLSVDGVSSAAPLLHELAKEESNSSTEFERAAVSEILNPPTVTITQFVAGPTEPAMASTAQCSCTTLDIFACVVGMFVATIIVLMNFTRVMFKFRKESIERLKYQRKETVKDLETILEAWRADFEQNEVRVSDEDGVKQDVQ